jgi:hypothetical protein
MRIEGIHRRHSRRPALLVLALTLVGALTIGCGSTVTSGTPGTQGPSTRDPTTQDPTTQDQTTQGPSTSGPGTGPDVRFDTSATAIVFAAAHTRATIAGVQGSSSTTVYGDGRIVRPRADGVTQEQLRIDQESLQDFMNQVAALRGSADPGSPVTDVGWTTVSFTIDGRTSEIRMGDVPSGSGSGPDTSPAGRARVAVGAVLDRLAGLHDLTVVAAPTPIPVTTFVISARVHDDGEVAWPFDRPAAAIFNGGRCVALRGAEAEQAAQLLISRGRNTSGRPTVRLKTGDPMLPGLEISQADTCRPDDPPRLARPLPNRWPAADRRWSTGYESLVIGRALNRLSGSSDPKLHGYDAGDLEFANSTATIDGRPVYDLDGYPPGQAAAGAALHLRLDGRTGRILASATDS